MNLQRDQTSRFYQTERHTIAGNQTEPCQEIVPAPDWIALSGVVVTAGLHFLLQAKKPMLGFIVGASLFWVVFVIIRAHQNRNLFRDWGFRIDNLREASRIPLIAFAVAAVAFAIHAHLHSRLHFPAQILVLLVLYPIWGVIQQFLVLAIVAMNLERVAVLRGKRVLLILVVAVLFALLHIHDARLVVATFILELLIVPLYLKHRNLWPAAFLHGWLGGLFYLWVLNRNLWVEHFG